MTSSAAACRPGRALQHGHVVELLLPGWAVGARLVYAGTVSAFGCGLAHLDYECCRLHSGMSVLFWVFLGAQIRLTARAAALVLPGLVSSMCVAGGSTEECDGVFHYFVVVPGYMGVMAVVISSMFACALFWAEFVANLARKRGVMPVVREGLVGASTSLLFIVFFCAIFNSATIDFTRGVLVGNYTLGAEGVEP